MIRHLSDLFHLHCRLLVFIFMNVQEVSLHYPVASHRDLLWARLFSLFPAFTKAPAHNSDADDSHISTPELTVLSSAAPGADFGHCLTVMKCLRHHALRAAKALLMCKYRRILKRAFHSPTTKIQEKREGVTFASAYSQVQFVFATFLTRSNQAGIWSLTGWRLPWKLHYCGI